MTFFVATAFSSAHAIQCSNVLGQSSETLSVRLADLDRDVSSKKFVIRDLNNSQVEFAGHLNLITGNLSISAQLSFPNEGFRSSISGSKVYDEMIEHFGIENIRSISGTWVDGDNLNSYNSNIAAGMTEEQSALATWSGQKATKIGFSKVFSVDGSVNLMTGQLFINVLFIRP